MITDQTILSEIQRTTLENSGDGGASWPSAMWTREEVLGYLNQRQNRFLAESLLLWTVAQVKVAVGVSDQPRPEDWVASVQMAYRGGNGTYTLLDRTDLRQLDLSHPGWPGQTTNAVPVGVYEVEGETLVDYVVPIPTDPQAYLERYYVAMGVELVQDPPTLFTVPDEFVPTIKYGALADMFSKVGPASNPVVAEMAEARWQEGIALATLMSTEGWMVG